MPLVADVARVVALYNRAEERDSGPPPHERRVDGYAKDRRTVGFRGVGRAPGWCSGAALDATGQGAGTLHPRIYCIDKTANPSTVTVGERITFTITDRCAINTCLAFGALVDELPSGLRIESVEDSDPNFQCSTNVNTVTCPEVTFTSTQPFTVTIVATTTKCDTFTNTASDGSRSGQASFTVEHCVPTTKAQCKNGGWRDLGWPDQGTCITAVNQNRP